VDAVSSVEPVTEQDVTGRTIEHSVVGPAATTTVPLGELPAEDTAEVKLRVCSSPYTTDDDDGDSDTDTEVVPVPDTVTLSMFDSEAAKLLSPVYSAVMEWSPVEV
jgi:hypothetical protein